MAKYHYEHENDNEDHLELQNFLDIENIYEVYPENFQKISLKREIISLSYFAMSEFMIIEIG